MAVLWPVTSAVGPARIPSAIALFSLCTLGGTSLTLLVGSGSRIALAVFPLLLALALRWALRSFREAVEAAPEEKGLLWLLGAAGCFLSLWGRQFPLFQYDGLLYHMPTAALAWQERTLFPLSSHPQIGANPILPELAKVWSFAFAGDDSLCALQQIPYLLGLAALAFHLAKQLGARRAHCYFAAAAMLLLPKAFEQSISPGNDVITSFWGALSAMLLARRKFIPSAVALLFFAQMKYPSVLPSLAGAAVLFFFLYRERPAKAVAWAVIFAGLGGFWEWKNLLVFGNPTHPYQIRLSGEPPALLQKLAPSWFVTKEKEDREKWPGYFVNDIEAAAGTNTTVNPIARYWLAWGDSLIVPYDRFAARWGPAWFLFALPSLALLLWLRARRWRRPRDATLLLSFALSLLFYFLTTKSWEARFGLLLAPFGFAAMAWQLSLARRWPVLGNLTGAFSFLVLAWCGVQIAFSHPYPRFFSAPAESSRGLYLTTPDPQIEEVEALAAALDELAPASLWIDFTYGQRHQYGMPHTLLYPFFSRQWSRNVRIGSSLLGAEKAAEEITMRAPGALLLQPGTRLDQIFLAKLGYRLARVNKAGALYARQ